MIGDGRTAEQWDWLGEYHDYDCPNCGRVVEHMGEVDPERGMICFHPEYESMPGPVCVHQTEYHGDTRLYVYYHYEDDGNRED